MKKIKGLALAPAVMLALPTGGDGSRRVVCPPFGSRIRLVCGEGWKDNAYDSNGLLGMEGYDAAYVCVAVERISDEEDLFTEHAENLEAVYVCLDYRFWSNPPEEPRRSCRFCALHRPRQTGNRRELTVQLLQNDAPMANVDVLPDGLNHHTERIETGENSMAAVKAANGGVNVIGCEKVSSYEKEGVKQQAIRYPEADK